MNVLITGSKGFLGKKLTNELIKLNYNITEYDIQNGYDILNKNQLEHIILDNNINTIIHLAAVANLNIFAENIDTGFKINLIGTQNILDLCEIYNIRLLFASTCCCYGNGCNFPSTEDDQIFPCEAYAKSKALGEELVVKSNLQHVSMRLATFYGPDMRDELAPAIFLKNAHNNEPILIHGNGKQTRTFTYVDDIVSGIITILKSKTYHKIINVTGTETISVLQIIDIIEEIMNKKCIIEFVKDREGQIYKEDISNTRLKELGWEPKVLFKEGMKNSYRHFLSKTKKF